MTKRIRLFARIAFLAALLRPGTTASAEPTAIPAHYAPYAFLIGEWNLTPEGGGPALGVTRFRWGPNRSYIWYSQSFLEGDEERPHFEGLLVWNGERKNVDMLLVADLDRGLVQERGTLAVLPDGTVVRAITATYAEGAAPMGGKPAGPAGATARFRQTFRRESDDRVSTRVLRENAGGWMATFPGSDRLVMTRRPESSGRREHG